LQKKGVFGIALIIYGLVSFFTAFSPITFYSVFYYAGLFPISLFVALANPFVGYVFTPMYSGSQAGWVVAGTFLFPTIVLILGAILVLKGR
jgi:hypothetical protein